MMDKWVNATTEEGSFSLPETTLAGATTASPSACVYANPTTTGSNTAITVVILILLFCGVAGNLLTICVIIKKKSLRTTFNLFLVSLCASDLISAVVCSPLWMYRRTWGFEDWCLGSFMCKFYWVVDFATNYATALHILCFAVLRYAAVKRPLFMMRLTKTLVRILTIALWMIAFAVATPIRKYMDVRKLNAKSTSGTRYDQWPSCSIIGTEANVQSYHEYISIVYPIFLYIPGAIVIVLSIFISRELARRPRLETMEIHVETVDREHSYSGIRKCHTMPSNTDIEPSAENHNFRHFSLPRNFKYSVYADKNAISRVKSEMEIFPKEHSKIRAACTQLSLIVACFLFGYIPCTMYILWTTALSPSECNNELDYWLGVASYLCVRLSECLNPVMYNLGCAKMRRASVDFIKRNIVKKIMRR